MPKYAFFLAVLISGLAFVIVTGAILSFPVVKSYGILLATASCCVMAVIFALVWPSHSWRWGVWLSGGFWFYFSFVFLAFLLNDSLVWLPAIYALGVLIPACIAGLVGQKLSRVSQQRN